MAYYLAVDAGGSKTDFLLTEDNRELARTRTGTIKRVNADEHAALDNLRTALDALQSSTGVHMSQITRTCIGTSGVTVPMVTDWLRQSFAAHIGGALILVGDVEIALDAAFHGGRGILVLAGTGSNVAARTAGNEIHTAGGWGPMLADQGSGHWIGLEGLRRGFLARDEGRTSSLLEAACRLWDLPGEDALIEFANTQFAQRYASRFAPEVVRCAHEGDIVAAEILIRGGQDLAYLASLLVERMRGLERAAFSTPTVAVCGSILAKVPEVRNAMQDALRDRYADMQFLADPVDPIRGALWRALRGV